MKKFIPLIVLSTALIACQEPQTSSPSEFTNAPAAAQEPVSLDHLRQPIPTVTIDESELPRTPMTDGLIKHGFIKVVKSVSKDESEVPAAVDAASQAEPTLNVVNRVNDTSAEIITFSNTNVSPEYRHMPRNILTPNASASSSAGSAIAQNNEKALVIVDQCSIDGKPVSEVPQQSPAATPAPVILPEAPTSVDTVSQPMSSIYGTSTINDAPLNTTHGLPVVPVVPNVKEAQAQTSIWDRVANVVRSAATVILPEREVPASVNVVSQPMSSIYGTSTINDAPLNTTRGLPVAPAGSVTLLETQQ